MEFLELLGHGGGLSAGGGARVAEEIARGEALEILRGSKTGAPAPPVLLLDTPRKGSLAHLEEAEIERIALEKLKKRYVKKSTALSLHLVLLSPAPLRPLQGQCCPFSYCTLCIKGMKREVSYVVAAETALVMDFLLEGKTDVGPMYWTNLLLERTIPDLDTGVQYNIVYVIFYTSTLHSIFFFFFWVATDTCFKKKN